MRINAAEAQMRFAMLSGEPDLGNMPPIFAAPPEPGEPEEKLPVDFPIDPDPDKPAAEETLPIDFPIDPIPDDTKS